jgi:hypothetical protein
MGNLFRISTHFDGVTATFPILGGPMHDPVTIPVDQPVWEGEIATYWFEGDVLVSRSKSIRRTVENLRANAALIKEITGGHPTPLLIYLTDSPMPDKAARALSNELLPKNYSAMAMISPPGLARFIMKLLFGLRKPPIPMKVFDEARDAKAWLLQYL